MEKNITDTITALYRGTLQTLAPEGQQTGIYKHPIAEAEVSALGIIGDVQADKRVHGGVEKALHQYALASYNTLTAHYPALINIAVAGSIGENISSPLMDDRNVFIGDIYQMGDIIVQVSQPRSPCWKINHRFDIDLLSKFIAEQHITGWYYRVLQTGHLQVGDAISLIERYPDNISVAAFNEIITTHRPALDLLISAAACQGLNPDWKARLRDRLDYLIKLN